MRKCILWLHSFSVKIKSTFLKDSSSPVEDCTYFSIFLNDIYVISKFSFECWLEFICSLVNCFHHVISICLVFSLDLVTSLDVLKHLLVLFFDTTTWALNHHYLKNLFNSPMHLYWFTWTSTLDDCASPSHLGIHTFFAKQSITILAFQREWLNNVIAKATDEHVCYTCHFRCFVNLQLTSL